jgi:hypothetical protein
LIEEWTADGTLGTKTFSSIPGSYTDLQVLIRGRGDTAATSVGVTGLLNGDSGANYDNVYLQGANATASAASEITASNLNLGALPAASFANEAGVLILNVYHYLSAFHKKWLADMAWRTADSAAGSFIQKRAGNWSSTAAVTSITINAAAGNFVSGSKISLYGIR